MRLPFSTERRSAPHARSFYDGISAFKGYMFRTFKYGNYPYDWADLAPWERSGYARRETLPRERREVRR